MNVLSLFAGIGGLELGLERAGMTTVGQVEIDPFCRRVLAKHWPEVPRHDDVRTAVDWWRSQDRPDVDVICGGFPCQDISSANTAGPRAGLAGAKSRLWGAYAAVVGAVRPEWVIVENSPRWRTWTPTVRSDLHRLGYGTAALELPAGSLGAPHRRPRCVVVAHADSDREPLRALHAQVAQLRPLPKTRWLLVGSRLACGSGPWGSRTGGPIASPRKCRRPPGRRTRRPTDCRRREEGRRMMPGPTWNYGESIPCRDGQHNNCWRRTAFGGLLLECVCLCHGDRQFGRVKEEDEG